MSPLLVVVAFLGLVAASRRTRSTSSTGKGSWTRKSSSVVLSAEAEDFLDELADATGLDLVVTSGTRSYQEQADAMLAKVDRGEDLHDVYADDAMIDALLRTSRSSWAATIEAWTKAGHVLSWHLTGRGLDLRTRDLSDSQVAQLQQAAEDLGADTLLESDHLHVEEF